MMYILYYLIGGALFALLVTKTSDDEMKGICQEILIELDEQGEHHCWDKEKVEGALAIIMVVGWIPLIIMAMVKKK